VLLRGLIGGWLLQWADAFPPAHLPVVYFSP
jgi:hypothetical protein